MPLPSITEFQTNTNESLADGYWWRKTSFVFNIVTLNLNIYLSSSLSRWISVVFLCHHFNLLDAVPKPGSIEMTPGSNFHARDVGVVYHSTLLC